ncbi:MAG: hypothetical protein KDB23_32275, partial [Planctomycetales bacterium]|nr:hypothetical protein [Planctomycetales bacterium]
GTYQTLTYDGAGVSADRVRVRFANDGDTATGLDRNLRIDRIEIDGTTFQTEWPNVWSTGTYVDPIGCVPGYQESEFLHCDGYFEYSSSSPTGSTITVYAAAATGSERMQLLIDGVDVQTWDNVGGNYVDGDFQAFTYTAGSAISADRIRIAFTNDGATASGADRNLRVDAIAIDGLRYEAESPAVYSTGTWVDPIGCVPGYHQSEYLACGGYLQFADVASNGSVVTIHAAGATGQERLELQIDGSTVRAWDNVGGDYNARQFQTFTYTTATPVSADQLRILFANDGATVTGVDKNLRVDMITIDGTVYQTEAANVFSTGTWVDPIGCVPGFQQSEYLHCGGYFDFGSASGGVVSLVDSVIQVDEDAATTSVTVHRLNGSDGNITVDYRTVASTATGGVDFVEQSGTLTLLHGETEQTLVLQILDDSIQEGNETFGFAIDNVNGGASLGAPR